MSDTTDEQFSGRPIVDDGIASREDADSVGSNKHKRAENLAATRRRFLRVTSSAVGASLAAVGYGFVPSKDAMATIGPRASAGTRRPLSLPVPGLHERIATFAGRIIHDPTARASFRNDPVDALISSGVVPPNSRITISKGNALFFYLLTNDDLQRRLLAAVAPFSGIRNAVNPYTKQNVNVASVPTMRNVDYAYTESTDFARSLEAQMAVLLGDTRVCEILGISADVAHRDAVATTPSKRLTDQAEAYNAIVRSRGGPSFSDNSGKDHSPVRDLRAYLVVLNLNVLANANYQYNANYNSNVNVLLNLNISLNANANAATNYNYSTAGPGDADISGFGSLSETSLQKRSLKRFCDQLSGDAERVSQAVDR